MRTSSTGETGVIMFSCDDAARYIARRADGTEALDNDAGAKLDAHLTSCASCRAALDAQRIVAAELRRRPADMLSPAFAARLAERLDEASGWFGIADWRVWTFRLAPIAAALAITAFLTSGESTETSMTLDDWTFGADAASAASVLWQPDVTTESVIDTMLTGRVPGTAGGSGDVR